MTKDFLYFQFPWQMLMLAIFIQSSIGSLQLPDFGFDLMDKVTHFFVFGILAILTARGLRKAKNRLIQEHYLLFTSLMCIIYGASDEFHQYFVPGRDSSWGDLIADTLGVIVLGLVYQVVINLKELRLKSQNELNPKYGRE